MRKTKLIQIKDGDKDSNRDYMKCFMITEMSALAAEKWAMKALLLAMKYGAELPDNVRDGGMAGIAVMGIKAVFGGVDWKDVEPLLDEMFTCVQIMPDPGKPDIIRNLTNDDIEEVTTRIQLRAEVFNLHLNFSLAGLQFSPTMKSNSAATAEIQSPELLQPEMSPEQSHLHPARRLLRRSQTISR